MRDPSFKRSTKKVKVSKSALHNDTKARPSKYFAGRNGSRIEKMDYRPEFAERAKLLCAKGATTNDLADHFGVRPSTILEWRAFQEDFEIASRPVVKALIARVNEILFESAIGSDRMTENVRMIRHNPVTVRYRKHTPGNVEAQKFLLTNLKPNEWSTHPEPKPKTEDYPFVRLYEAICGTKFTPNEDQQAYYDRLEKAEKKGVPSGTYNEPKEEPNHSIVVTPNNPNED